MKRFATLPTILQLLVVAFIGGAIGPVSKIGLRTIPPTSFAALRLLIVALFLLLCVRYVTKTTITKQKIKLFLGLSTFWWLNTVLVTAGLQKTTAITAQFIHISVPILTAVFSLLFLKRGLKGWQWLGVGVAAVGVTAVIVNGHSLSFGTEALRGNLLVLSSAIVFSLYAVFSQKDTYKSLTPSEMILIAASAGAVATMPFAVNETITTGWWRQIDIGLVGVVLLTGVLSGLFYIVFQWLMKHIGASQATLNLYLLPLFVIGWAAVLLNERPNVQIIFGGAIALLGVWLVTSFGNRSATAKISKIPE